MNKEELESQLILLPGEIAAEATAILDMMNRISRIEPQIDLIEVALKGQVWGDKTLTNETQRKSVYVDMLTQNKDYEQKCINRDRYKLELELTRIAHQRKRDMMNVLIAIAGVKT